MTTINPPNQPHAHPHFLFLIMNLLQHGDKWIPKATVSPAGRCLRADQDCEFPCPLPG